MGLMDAVRSRTIARYGLAEPNVDAPTAFQSTLVFDRGKLLRGNVLAGPAIIEEPDASTLVHPGWTATVDEYGNLVLGPSPR